MEKDRFDKYSKEELIQLLLKYEGFKDSILAKQNIVLKVFTITYVRYFSVF